MVLPDKIRFFNNSHPIPPAPTTKIFLDDISSFSQTILKMKKFYYWNLGWNLVKITVFLNLSSVFLHNVFQAKQKIGIQRVQLRQNTIMNFFKRFCLFWDWKFWIWRKFDLSPILGFIYIFTDSIQYTFQSENWVENMDRIAFVWILKTERLNIFKRFEVPGKLHYK